MSTQETGELYILVARPPQVVSIKPDGSAAVTILPDASDTPDGIAIDTERGYIYWSNMGHSFSENDGYIQRMRLDGTEVETLIQAGQTFTPKQLILDLPDQKMYWCDREGMRVMRASLDGSDIEVLVQTGDGDTDRLDETRHCVGIAIDKVRKQLYWTQKGPPNGGKGRIFRASLDISAGQQPDSRGDIELLFDHLPEPIDLEFDPEAGYLYWTDRGDPPQGNTLNRAKVTAETVGPHVILAGGLQEGIGLVLAKDLNAIFTTDLGGVVLRFEGPNFNTSTVVSEMKKPLTGIAYSSKS